MSPLEHNTHVEQRERGRYCWVCSCGARSRKVWWGVREAKSYARSHRRTSEHKERSRKEVAHG